MELSWKDYLRIVIKHWKLIAIIMLISVAVVVVLTQFLFKPAYEIESKLIYRINKEISAEAPGNVDLSKLTIDQNVQNDLISLYFAYLTSKSVYDRQIYPNIDKDIKKVILSKNMEYKDIINMIKIEQVGVSYTITAETTNQELGFELLKLYNTKGKDEAQREAKADINVFGATITYTLDVDVLDEPTIKKDESGLLRSIIMGLLAGIIVSAVVIIILVYAASRIRSPKDITKDLDITVMGIIPPAGKN